LVGFLSHCAGTDREEIDGELPGDGQEEHCGFGTKTTQKERGRKVN